MSEKGASGGQAMHPPPQGSGSIGWESDADQENPVNWARGKKWLMTVLVSAITFITPVSSSMIAPAIPQVAKDLSIESSVEGQLTLSVFILGYALAPLVLAPASEVFGRVSILHLSNAFFVVWTLACGFAQSGGQMVAFRLLSGLGGGAPLAIAGGVLSDMWSAEERGKILSIFVMIPLLAPVLGPIAGGWMIRSLSWRWIFWAISAVDCLILILALAFLRETYAPKILASKAVRLGLDTQQVRLSQRLRTALLRPFAMLVRHSDIQFIALYLTYLYGVLYLIISTFPGLWTSVYGETTGIGALNYLSLGTGLMLGSFISAYVSNQLYAKIKARNHGIGRPEYRIPLTFFASFFVPAGLFWYGWSAQNRLYWVMPNVGMAIFAVGNVVCSLGMQLYVVDAYQQYAASAIASIIVLRSIAGFAFPLFAPDMYNALGYGWSNSLLGFVAVLVGIPAPWVLWFWGERLRARSSFAV